MKRELHHLHNGGGINCPSSNMNGLQEGNVDDDPTTTTIKNTTTNWIVPSRSPESSAWSNAEFGSRSHGSQLELGLLHHSKMNGSSSPPSSCPSNPMNTSIEMSVPIHAHQDEEAFPSSQGDENTLKHSLQKGSSVKKEASHHHHSSKYSSSIKTLLLHAVESIPSSLITVMNVLVIFFLLQSLITIGTTFFILFFEGSTVSLIILKLSIQIMLMVMNSCLTMLNLWPIRTAFKNSFAISMIL